MLKLYDTCMDHDLNLIIRLSVTQEHLPEEWSTFLEYSSFFKKRKRKGTKVKSVSEKKST